MDTKTGNDLKNENEFEKFDDLLRKVVRVPKDRILEREKEEKEKRKQGKAKAKA
jgi:hypothetical protein